MVPKFWSDHFVTKNLCFLGVGPPKNDRNRNFLSDFDEIRYIGVFEGADFKNRIYFYVRSFPMGL